MKISIIIATYNAAHTLNRCLDSILPQITSDVELILIDGASSDSTNQIISSYGDKICIHISEPDCGIYDAWNKGVRFAHGNWIMFIGADDILLPNSINLYLKVINETNSITSYDYICAKNEYVDKNGHLLKILGQEPSWNKMRQYMSCAHVASLHNKHNLFEILGDYNLNFRICADYELLMRKRDKLKYMYLDSHIARMCIGGMSFSTNAIIETFKIRKLYSSVPLFFNFILLIRDYLGYISFKLRSYVFNKGF